MPRKVVSLKPKLAQNATRGRRLSDQEKRDAERTTLDAAIEHLQRTPGYRERADITDILTSVIAALKVRCASLGDYKRVVPRAPRPEPPRQTPASPTDAVSRTSPSS